MRKLVYTFFLSILALGLTRAQLVNKVVIDGFESSAADTLYQLASEGTTVFTAVDDATDKHEGSKSLRVRINIPSGIHDYGSYGQLIYRVEEDAPLMNWSGSDSLSIWLKVIDPPATPANVVFRFHIMDRPVEGGNSEEHIYENATILDAASDWVNLRVPLFDRQSDGQLNPDATGFCVVPSNWNPPAQNNKRLDLDKVVGYNITFVTTTSAGDSIEVLYDDFARFGYRKTNFWVFNGKVTSSTNAGAWSSGYAIEPNAGSSEGKAGIKWTMNPGWCGLYFDYPVTNMAGNWILNDTLKLKVKAPAEADTIRVQFGSVNISGTGSGSVKYFLTKAAQGWDGTWKTIEIPLDDPKWEVEAAGFDSSQVNKFEIVSAGGNTFTGDIYFDDVWLGSPTFDVVAPAKPTNLLITPTEHANTILFKEVPGESQEVYTIYFSKEPITDVNAKGVGVAKLSLAETGTENSSNTYTHKLFSPNSDQDLTYYYAVVCTDAAGNISPIATSSAVTNTAMGIPTLSLSGVPNFTADGNLSEWSSITPFKVWNQAPWGYVNANDPLQDSTDLLGRCYVTFDKDYLYVAFDMADDIYYYNPTASTYLNDCADLFIGLYNSNYVKHTSIKRGAEPDYHFRFDEKRAMIDGGVDSVAFGENYSFVLKDAGDGYTIESKISLASLASRMKDSLFVPTKGLNIPIDLEFNDADATNTRESILFMSEENEDLSYQNPWRWINTWIEDWIGVQDEPNFAPIQYSLSQNYPNPFNPSTTIKYSIQVPGLVKIKVFNILGAEVATLVNEIQTAGNHQVSFNASRLSSGVYFYSIESGSFRNVKKMVFLK